MEAFRGYHSEWNLGSPGGWDYQRITQRIGKAVWQKLNRIKDFDLVLDFDDPLFSPVDGFAQILVEAHRAREGDLPGLIAVVAEEETLADVTENKNFANRLNAFDGISGALMAPHELEICSDAVCWRGQPVSTIFMDFNTDVLLNLHRKHNLAPLLRAVGEGRVVNPRGTELPGSSFDHVIIMGNSLGYIQAPDADSRIIAEAYRVLRPGGWLLADVTDGSIVKNDFTPNSWHEIGSQTVVCRNRELRENAVVARELVIDKQKGLVRDRTYAIRLYDSEGLGDLLRQAGFGHIEVYTNFSPQHSDGDYGFMNNRMLAVGRKA